MNIDTKIISIATRQEVLSRLRAAESEYDAKVLLAIESGSRAWGFASANSDYDARFIYVHPPEWYLSIGLEEKRDVIEYQTPAPIEFQRLLEFVAGDDGLRNAIDDLLAVKRESPEMGLSPQIAPIQKFVERELAQLEHVNPVRNDRADVEPLLSDLFRAILKETWG